MILDDVSQVLGVPVKSETIDKVLAELDVTGKLDQAKVWRMIVLLVKKIESYESAIQPKSKRSSR